MVRRLPPLNALRAFEAAARHLSFTLAAEELYVTPAAVSHQVKALEDRLGLALFRRLHNGLALTEAGEAYLPLLTEGFDKLAEAGERLLAIEDRRVLNVAVLPSVAVKWLAHRLSGFYQSHPGIDVRIDATDQKVDFVRQEMDLALCYGTDSYPGEEVEELFTDRMFPVCSPRLLEGSHSLGSPEDLQYHTLLHIEWRNKRNVSPDWQTWLQAAEVTGLDLRRGPRFTLSSMAIEAAIDGQGVAMGQHLFADDDIASGRLVRPFSLSLPLEHPYCIACPRSAAANPAVNAFRDWILAEAERYRAAITSAQTPTDRCS